MTRARRWLAAAALVALAAPCRADPSRDLDLRRRLELRPELERAWWDPPRRRVAAPDGAPWLEVSAALAAVHLDLRDLGGDVRAAPPPPDQPRAVLGPGGVPQDEPAIDPDPVVRAELPPPAIAPRTSQPGSQQQQRVAAPLTAIDLDAPRPPDAGVHRHLDGFADLGVAPLAPGLDLDVAIDLGLVVVEAGWLFTRAVGRTTPDDDLLVEDAAYPAERSDLVAEAELHHLHVAVAFKVWRLIRVGIRPQLAWLETRLRDRVSGARARLKDRVISAPLCLQLRGDGEVVSGTLGAYAGPAVWGLVWGVEAAGVARSGAIGVRVSVFAESLSLGGASPGRLVESDSLEWLVVGGTVGVQVAF